MDYKLIKKEEILTSMLINWIDKMEFLDNDIKVMLLRLSMDLLYKDKKLRYNIDKEELNRSLDGLGLKAENKKEIVCTLIDFSEEVLPIGSVVVLKEDFVKSENGKEIKIIITNRFLCNEKAGIYFTYSGAIYPSGMLIDNKLINFNKECIEKICHIGLKDEDEENYVLAAKNDVIINRNMHSVTLASKEQLKILDEEIKKQEE